MSLLSKLADRTILCPSTHSIDPGDNRREVIHSEGGINTEAYISTWGDFDSSTHSHDEKLLVLKIPGTGGRAERSTVHPCELIVADGENSQFKAAQVWTLNHRGYGQSTGPASLQNFVSTLENFWSFIERQFPKEKKMVTGNSLGCMSALYLARHKTVDSLLIRNPPPLARLISDRPRYNAWNFGFGKLIANQIPQELDSLLNASKSKCPGLLVTSEKDRVVPFKYQKDIKDAYLGPMKQFVIQGADHADRIPAHQESEYLAAVNWLGEALSD